MLPTIDPRLLTTAATSRPRAPVYPRLGLPYTPSTMTNVRRAFAAERQRLANPK
jgi:hypothetical protein